MDTSLLLKKNSARVWAYRFVSVVSLVLGCVCLLMYENPGAMTIGVGVLALVAAVWIASLGEHSKTHVVVPHSTEVCSFWVLRNGAVYPASPGRHRVNGDVVFRLTPIVTLQKDREFDSEIYRFIYTFRFHGPITLEAAIAFYQWQLFPGGTPGGHGGATGRFFFVHWEKPIRVK